MRFSSFAIAAAAAVLLSEKSIGSGVSIGKASFLSASAKVAAVKVAEQRELQGATTGKGTEDNGNKGNKNDDKGNKNDDKGDASDKGDTKDDTQDDSGNGEGQNAPKDKEKKLSSEYVVDIPPSQRNENAGQRPKSKDDEDLAKIPANVTAGSAAPYDPARAKTQTNVLDPDGNLMTDSELDELYAAVVIDGMTLTPGGLDPFILGGGEGREGIGGGANDTQHVEDAESEERTFDSIMSERLPIGSVRPDKGKALATKERPGRDKVAKPSDDKPKGGAGDGDDLVGGKGSGNGNAGAGKSSSETKRHLQTSVGNTASIGTFKPLACNSALESAGCSSPLSSLSWDGMSKLVVPCGACYTYDLGANVTMPKGLDVVGKLRFPPNYKATITTPSVVVQGELEITSTLPVSSDNLSVKFVLTGTADTFFVPAGPPNADACVAFGSGGCPLGRKPFVVAGGKLNVRGLDASVSTWAPLLSLARGQAKPLSEGEYDVRPAPTAAAATNPLCPANGDVMIETFGANDANNNGLGEVGSVSGSGDWVGGYGASCGLDGDGNLVVSNRKRDWQGPTLDFTNRASCIRPDTTYLLTIRYKLDRADGSQHGMPTTCDLTNGKCLQVLTQIRRPNDSDIYATKANEYWKQGRKYGEWSIFASTISFTQDEMNPDNIFFVMFLRGPDAGVNITVASIEMSLPHPDSYPSADNDGAKVCKELISNGGAELHGLNPYPFSKNTGSAIFSVGEEEIATSPEVGGENTRTNRYYSLVGREWGWNSARSYINARCLQMGLTYTISFKLRVHSAVAAGSVVQFAYSRLLQDGVTRQHTGYYGIIECPPQSKADGWKECRRDFTVDARLSTEPIPGTLYWEIFLQNGVTADVDYDDMSIMLKGGPVEGLLVPSAGVAGWWGHGTEIRVTSGSYEPQHGQSAIVASVLDRGDGTAQLALETMLGGAVITEEDMPGMGAEVALLSRNVAVEATAEEVNMGGYLQVMHTPGVVQTIEGVALRNMGQLGVKNRYPLHLLYSGSIIGSSISRNSIISSNMRCVVIEGTSDAVVASNVAHDTAGHCFYVGYESTRNVLRKNIGTMINKKINWNNRLLGDNDYDGTTFFVLDVRNDFVGNVAAGSPWEGFRITPSWWTPGENGANTGVNGRRHPLGLFKDNVAHSNRHGLYIRDLEQAFSGHASAVLENVASYKNREWGIYQWASENLTFAGGIVAECRWGIGLHYGDSQTLSDIEIRGISDLTMEHVSSVLNSWKMCSGYAQEGLKLPATILRPWNTKYGAKIKNVTFSGFDNPKHCPGSVPVTFFTDTLQNMVTDYFTNIESVTFLDSRPASINMCSLSGLGVDDILIMDIDGASDPTGKSNSPSSIVSNEKVMTNLTTCTPYPSQCFSYCPDVCMRTVRYRIERDGTEGFTLRVTDTATGKYALVSGKIYNFSGATNPQHERTLDDKRRDRFFSASLPGGSGPYTAEFLDLSGSVIWPRFVEEEWEPVPPCVGAPGAGSVNLVIPEPVKSDLESIVANGNLEATTLGYWHHNGGGANVVPGYGFNASKALVSMNRNSWWQWHGQYVDIRAINSNPDKLYELEALLRLTDKFTGGNITCNPNADRWSGGCPRVTFRWAFYTDPSLKDGRYYHHYKGDIARTVANYDPNKLNMIHGIIAKPESDSRYAGSHELLMYIEHGLPEWQFIIDEVSLKPIESFPTCEGNPIRNSDFASGDSRHWQWWGASHLSMEEGVDGPGDFSVKVTNRQWSDWGIGQRISIDCLEIGDRFAVSARYKILKNGAVAPCNKQTWDSGKNRCSDILTWKNKNGQSASYRAGHTVASASAFDGDEWEVIAGVQTVTDGWHRPDEFIIRFEGADAYADLIVDNISLRKIPLDCDNLLLNPSVDETTSFWLPQDRYQSLVGLISPGASGSPYAMHIKNRMSTWVGAFQDIDSRCFVEGAEYSITGKFKLLNSTQQGAQCDPRIKGHNDQQCPQVLLEAYNCQNSGNIYLRFWNDIPFFQWKSDDFNDFEATFIIDSNLASCQNIRVHVRDVRKDWDIIVDDLQISPPAAPTLSPTATPIMMEPSSVSPTLRPTIRMLAPTTNVTNCPLMSGGTISEAAEISAGPILLVRSSDVCLLTKRSSSNFSIPLARSYEGNDWEPAAGDVAEEIFFRNEWACYTSGCQATLPPLSSEEKYYLTSYRYDIPDRDQVARFLESATFGTTKSELDSWDYTDVTSSIVSWIDDQMRKDMTSHREHFRMRTNMRYDTVASVATTDHPCDAYSCWRKYVFTSFDNAYFKEDAFVTTAPLDNGSSPYALSLNGHYRTVVTELLFYDSSYVFDYSKSYQLCGWVNQNTFHVYADDGTCRMVHNPLVNFTSYENIPTVVFDLSNAVLQPIDQGITNGADVVLPSGLTGQICNTIPKYADGGNVPVFGVLSDGSWVQWDSRIHLRTNTLENPMPDGGGVLQAATSGAMMCSNAPRTFLNEDSCFLKSGASACTSAQMPEINIPLDDNNIINLHLLTGRYVYNIKGLVTVDLFGNMVPHPCTYGFRSRWQAKPVSSCNVTVLPAEVNQTIFDLLNDSGDDHPFLRDVELSLSGGEEGTPCNASATDPRVEILIGAICWEHVHPDLMSVYDITYWTNEDTHPGNAIAAMEGEPNPIKKWMDDESSANLTFPSMHTEHTHPITRWEDNYRKFRYIGRYGDSVRFRDLPNELRLDPVADHYSEASDTGVNSIIVCGSPGEVASEPSYGHLYEVSTGRDLSWWLHEQREWVWTMTGLNASDQLQQRVAWALSQTLVVVKLAIDGQYRHTESFLQYYDIFVRHAFGNYLDVLEEVSYSPLMAENLSYLGSKSAAYIYETLRRHNFPDENYAREIMQLFTIGLHELDIDGTLKRDENNNPIPTYTNEHIISFARAWTGFDLQKKRGNIEEPDSSGNRIDPMRIVPDWRDKFPKIDLNDGYIGDGYPLCVDLPSKMYLHKGARYRLLGGSSLPEWMGDPFEFKSDASIKKFVLDASSPLRAALCNSDGEKCRNDLSVVLNSTLSCSTVQECKVDTVRVVQVSEHIFYEYVRPPCVEQVFFNGAIKLSQRWSTYRTMCGHPKLPVASEACCATGSPLAMRNNVYDGERMTYVKAAERCSEISLFSCDFSSVSHDAWYKAANFHWTNDPCLVRVKVKSDNGYAAIVYEPSGYFEKVNHIDDFNRNYFKVYWNNGLYPEADGVSCGDEACALLSTGDCLCDTTVRTTRVFTTMPRNEKEVLLKLKIGALDPSSHDLVDEYVVVVDEAVGVTAYTLGGEINENTIFEVTDGFGRKRFLKNAREDVYVLNLDGSLSTMSFRNAPSFMSLVPSEATVRDAQYETKAVIEHYFYQENLAPFLAIRFIQRLVSSNPSPRYVKAVATAFRTGICSAAGHTFGSGHYGDLGATVACVLLDREARSVILDTDPATGKLREPLLKVMNLMRSMEYKQFADKRPITRLIGMENKIGEMAHEFTSVFSFFLPEHSPNGRIGEASLVAPEAMLVSMPKTVGLLNGMFSMIKYGLTDCHGGFGEAASWQTCNEGFYNRAYGKLDYNKAASPLEVVDGLATLLTAGRLSSENRRIVQHAYESTVNSTNDFNAGLRVAQQLIVTSPEFHSTNSIKKMNETRAPPEAPQASGQDYKAIIYIMFAGGCDSYNMLVPKTCSGAKDLYAEYNMIREQVALSKNQLLGINVTGQVCEEFGVHESLPIVQQLFNDGDLLFFANTGVLTQPVTKEDWWLNTVTPLFAHNHMQLEAMRVDPLQEASNTGVIGRMTDVLSSSGLSVGSFAVDHNSVALLGQPGDSIAPLIISQNGMSKFNPDASEKNMTASIFALNGATTVDSGFFSETWSDRLAQALTQNNELYNTLEGASLSVGFPATDFGRKLQIVSKMIATRAVRGVNRDMFYVDISGFDTHADVGEHLVRLFTEVNDAVSAFAAEMKAKDVWDKVTAIQTSDFARTLPPNTGDGTDHAWGGNYMMFGGSVKGGQIMGSYPDDLTDDGPLGIGRGRIIPETPWDACFHGLAQWAGVGPEYMSYICPNGDRFPGMLFDESALFVQGSSVDRRKYLRK